MTIELMKDGLALLSIPSGGINAIQDESGNTLYGSDNTNRLNPNAVIAIMNIQSEDSVTRLFNVPRDGVIKDTINYHGDRYDVRIADDSDTSFLIRGIIEVISKL